MGFGVANKIFASFSEPFWGERKGWINFIAHKNANRYPVAFILPESKRNILMFFVSARQSIILGELSDE
jgi:hypothetical protein